MAPLLASLLGVETHIEEVQQVIFAYGQPCEAVSRGIATNSRSYTTATPWGQIGKRGIGSCRRGGILDSTAVITNLCFDLWKPNAAAFIIASLYEAKVIRDSSACEDAESILLQPHVVPVENR